MKRFPLQLLCLASALGLASATPPPAELLGQELTQLMKAPYSGDVDLVLKRTHPRIVELAGGRDAFAQGVKELGKTLHDGGVTFDAAEAGTPYSGMTTEEREFFLVDVELKLKRGTEPLTYKLTQLAVRDLPEPIWRYIDTSGLDDTLVRELFPDLPAGFSLVSKELPPGGIPLEADGSELSEASSAPAVDEVDAGDKGTPDKRFLGTWRGETSFEEEGFHQVYRWWLVREADGSYEINELEYHPKLKVYTLESGKGRWQVKGDQYLQVPEEGEAMSWKIKSVGRDRIELLMIFDGQPGDTPDVDLRAEGKPGDFLKAPAGYRQVSREELMDLL